MDLQSIKYLGTGILIGAVFTGFYLVMSLGAANL